MLFRQFPTGGLTSPGSGNNILMFKKIAIQTKFRDDNSMHFHRHEDSGGCTSTRDNGDSQAERLTRRAFGLNALGMAAEVVFGLLSGSMSLLADGLHMTSDAVALAIALFAYSFARRNAGNMDFVFGAGKINALCGFASAVLMGVVTAGLAFESASRLAHPEPIAYGQALAVAALGLAINAWCAFMLHGQAHGNAHDHNLRAAYLHLLADALTSVLAVGALLGGRYLGLAWMDPAVGLIGALVVGLWAAKLVRDCSRVLLDRNPDPALVQEMREILERDGQAAVRHIAVWRISPNSLAAMITMEDPAPKPPEHYKSLLKDIDGLTRVLVEVHGVPCPMEARA